MVFVLIVALSAAAIFPEVYAHRPEASVSIAAGSSVLGCEERDECYVPSVVIVPVSGVVTWTNDDAAATTVTSGSPDVGPDGLFDSGLFLPDETFSLVFSELGEYSYFSVVHPWKRGLVVVTGDHGHDFVMTDKDVYAHGEPVAVIGQIVPFRPDCPATLSVIAPNGNLVALSQTSLGANGTFSTVIATNGSGFRVDSEYTIRAQYCGDAGTPLRATTTFSLGDMMVHYDPVGLYEPPGPPDSYEVDVIGGYVFDGMFGSVGSGPGQFMVPHAIAFGPGGIMAVADILNNRIQVFHANGTYAFEFGLEGEPGYVSYIAFGPGGIIAVSDIKNHRIQLFRPVFTLVPPR